MAPLPGIGLFAGRIGNFINGELWGKPTTVPWGFNVDGEVRHASQLYEACLEGSCCSPSCGGSPRSRGRGLRRPGCSWCSTASLRFLIEFVRVPDEHLGYLAGGWFTMGQAPVAADDPGRASCCSVTRTQRRVPSGNLAPAA